MQNHNCESSEAARQKRADATLSSAAFGVGVEQVAHTVPAHKLQRPTFKFHDQFMPNASAEDRNAANIAHAYIERTAKTGSLLEAWAMPNLGVTSAGEPPKGVVLR